MALASIAVTKNPLSWAAFERYELLAGARPIDWLLEHYPQGAGGRVYHWHNGELLDAPTFGADGAELTPGHPDYLSRPVLEDDCVILAIHPAEPISLTTIIVTAVVVAVVSAAVSIGLALLFPDPAAPAAAVANNNAAASPVYNVRSRQNTARLGEPIPVVYGEVLMTPDVGAQPYTLFQWPRDMYVDLLLVLGQGYFDIHEVLVGETETSAIEGNAAQYIQVNPNQHGGQFGTLQGISEANGWSPGFYENVWTSQEVGDQRFTDAGDSSGWYRLGRAGVQTGQTIFINVEWPRGLYQMADWGDPISTQCSFNLEVQQADADGNPIVGTYRSFTLNMSGNFNLDPVRSNFFVEMGYDAAWLVKLYRLTAQFPNGHEQNEFYWRSASLRCGASGNATAYGDVSLLMVRLKAEQVAASADRLVRVRMTRRLDVLGSGSFGATTSPADAFYDILTNPVYGARRPRGEIDIVRLNDLRTFWGVGVYHFNAVYTQRTTVWDALAQSVQGVAAAPLPIGGAMSLAQDGIRPARSMMFSEQNIVRGSFSLSYHFEQTGAADGVEIEYVDPQTWAPAYQRWPLESLSPDRVNLFGCSDPVQASQFARLQWQRRQMLRRLVEFQTELEGLIPYPSERIAVAHTLPRWGVSGIVANVEAGGLSIMLDRVLPWDEVPAPWYMMFRDQYSGASAVVEVDQHPNGPHWVVLKSQPWPTNEWIIGQRQEQTQFIWGDGERVVKDFTLTALAPRGGPGATNVTISGVVYDPAVYTGTLSFLQYPVP